MPVYSSMPTGGELILLDAWVADNPGSRAAIKLARAYHGLGRVDEAAEVLRKLLALRPEELEARELMARVLEDAGHPDGALEHLRLAAAQIMTHAPVFSSLARLLEGHGRDEEALRAKQLAEALRPPEDDALDRSQETATMASIYAAQGYKEQAERIYGRLAESQAGQAEHAQPNTDQAGPVHTVLGALQRLRDAAAARSVN